MCDVESLLKNSTKISVPVGCSALDKNTLWCKARTSAKSYTKSKPIKAYTSMQLCPRSIRIPIPDGIMDQVIKPPFHR